MQKPQVKLLAFPLDEQALEHEWGKLVGMHFVTLDRGIKSMVTQKMDSGEDEIRQDLLEELGWALSRKDFEDRVKGEALLEKHLHT